MTDSARVVVIGGGVVGCSVLFHLAKRGWKDCVLLERDILTCGSSWHAAGGFHTINGDPHIARLQHYTINLYKELEEISGQSCGLHITGGVMMAADEERLEWLRMSMARGRYLGLDLREVSIEEAKEVYPLFADDAYVGGVYDPLDGHLDPSGTTHAYAKAARHYGATIREKTRVEDIVQLESGEWRVITNQGEIIAEHVVNAGGLWAREVGRMSGLELPILAMEHHYLLTEAIPEVAEFNARTGREVGHMVDFAAEVYTRQERDGILVGTYERAATPWQPRQTPWDFSQELLAPDLDRIAPSLEMAAEHIPPFGEAGIRQIINGPFVFAPDGNPLIGPMRGLHNYWCAVGVMAGFSQGGGVGLALSNWIIDGDPGFDVWGMDIARFGDWATMAYTNAKVRENYSRRFRIKFPNEELPAARPLRTTPIYDRLKARGAVFGQSAGLEVPLWFAPEGVKDEHSFRRSTDFEHVAEEVRAVREGVGVFDATGFAKYEISGEGARDWLDRMLACAIPREGRMTLAPMLNEKGRVIGDFTLANLGAETFMIIGSGAAETYHMRWFTAHLPRDGSVTLRPRGPGLTGLAIAGPKARDLLKAVADDDADMKFMDIRRMHLNMLPCIVGRVSFTGDLGYEIWTEAENQRALYEALHGAGTGLRDFGLRALNALRLEKNFGSWATEYRPIYLPQETGLDRFCSRKKNADYIGRAAFEAAGEGAMRLCAFVVEAEDADPLGNEPIFAAGANKAIGWVTSGGYAHGSKASVAQGYIPREAAEGSGAFEIELMGRRRAARIQHEPLFDPDAARMRG